MCVKSEKNPWTRKRSPRTSDYGRILERNKYESDLMAARLFNSPRPPSIVLEIRFLSLSPFLRWIHFRSFAFCCCCLVRGFYYNISFYFTKKNEEKKGKSVWTQIIKMPPSLLHVINVNSSFYRSNLLGVYFFSGMRSKNMAWTRPQYLLYYMVKIGCWNNNKDDDGKFSLILACQIFQLYLSLFLARDLLRLKSWIISK